MDQRAQEILGLMASGKLDFGLEIVNGHVCLDLRLFPKAGWLYRLVWCETAYTSSIFLAQVLPSGGILADNLDHKDVVGVFKHALNVGLEAWIPSKFFEVDACLAHDPNCEFCLPLNSKKDYATDWLRCLIQVYKNI